MANILETARDLGQGIYTKAEVDDSLTDIQESSLSKVASNVLLSGNLALASSAVTKSNANITYTGNGTSQSITTGIGSVDFTVASNGSGYYHDRTAGDCIVKNDAGTIVESGSAVVNISKVHIKSRSSSGNNWFTDGLRGVKKDISPNLALAEAVYGNTVTNFNINGITVGELGDHNQVSQTYIAHQTLYTHIKWGLTNQGKRYLTAYNPVTREVMTMYQGSGIAGHQIPNPLGIKLDYWEVKSLDLVSDWFVRTDDSTDFLRLTTASKSSGGDVLWTSDTTTDYITVNTDGGVNASGRDYISYGFANSETKIITQYQGNGASGNFVETKDVNGVAKKPRRVIIKRTDSTGNWVWLDTERNTETQQLVLNLSVAENNYLYGMAINVDGFTTINNNAEVNASGGQYIAIVEFDTTNSTDDTYFDLPTDDTNLNVTAGKLPYTDGRDTTNGAYNVFTQSYTGTVDFSTCPDGIHYVALDSNNAPKFYKDVAIGLYDKTSADDNRLVFNTDDGKWYTTTDGELVTNGTFDSDTSGWTPINSILTVDAGAIKVADDGLFSLAYTSFSTVVGLSYNISIYTPTVSGSAYIYYGTRVPIAGSDFGEFALLHKDSGAVAGVYRYTITATSTTTYLSVGSGGSDFTRYDNISVFKTTPTLDTELSNPISFIDTKPYQVASGTPMDRLVDYPSIPKNVMESTTFDGFVTLKENKKVIDLGTIFASNRYVVDNPFGNDKYMDCDTKLQFFDGSIWFEGDVGFADGTNSRGSISGSLAEGIVIQTGNQYVVDTRLGSGATTSDSYVNFTSAPARVIVTYVGEAK